jgi:ATP-dependent Lhr-like helicase
LVLRESLPALLELLGVAVDPRRDLSSVAADVLTYLQAYGAAFLSEIARATGQLPSKTEEALWELVARGLVTGDGVAGLRTLLLPEAKRRQPHRHLRTAGNRRGHRLMPVGRWALLRDTGTSTPREGDDEFFARLLLRRYGIVLRDILARESRAPTWRVLLGVYRRLEARGEIRGGRFVAGFVGEQFALPEAVDTLRTVRRNRAGEETALVTAADPLNMVGILTPGARVSPFSNQVILYRDGVPLDVGQRGAVLSRLQRSQPMTRRRIVKAGNESRGRHLDGHLSVTESDAES